MDGKQGNARPRGHHQTPPAGYREDDGGVERLLEAWQASRAEQVFDEIVHRVSGLIQAASRQTLLKYDIRDLNAVDDVLSLVLDHLRRLAGSGDEELPVAAFQPLKHHRGRGGTTACRHDSGRAYVRWLARSRAADIARQRRRDTAIPLDKLAERHEMPVHFQFTPLREAFDRVLGFLDERSREVLTLLADGDTQAEIAAKLGVCEGTVSRIRSRAIRHVQERLGQEKPARRKPR